MGTDCRKYVLLDLDVIALTVVVERVCKEILSVHHLDILPSTGYSSLARFPSRRVQKLGELP